MARIGGAFPFPLAQVAEGGGVITLGSGGTFYPPPGEWLVTLGSQTVLQYYDPINQVWRGVQEPSVQGQYISTDGYNYRMLNVSGVVMGASITAAGTGATNGIGVAATGVSVTFTAPPSGQANLTATGFAIIGGSVQAPTIANAGSGFTTPPVIVIDPPPVGGVQATAICAINSTGGISSVTMVNVGAGYTAVPNFYIIPQVATYAGGPSGGFAAAAVPAAGLVYPTNAVPGNQNLGTSTSGAWLVSNALTGSGTLTGIGMVNLGNGYTGTSIPTVTIAGMSGSPAATAIMSLALQSVTLGAGGSGYGTGAAPVWFTSDGLVAGTNNNAFFLPRNAIGTTTVVGGSVTAFTVEDAGFGFQKVPQVTVCNTSAIATAQATGIAVVGGVNDSSLLQPRVQ